jgi:hypothetical protein
LKLAVYTSLSIYLGLLLLPEPTSKLIALGMSYRQLQEAVRSARSLLELRSIGERYGRVLGEQVGRVLLLVATAALGWTAHGMMKGPGLPGFGRAAQLLKAETELDLLAVARQVQAVVVARPAVTVTLTPTAAYMAQQGMSSSQGVRASAPASSKEGPAPKRHHIERVEEWRKPRLTPDGRVVPYKGTRQPPQPIAILGRNRAGKTVTNGRRPSASTSTASPSSRRSSRRSLMTSPSGVAATGGISRRPTNDCMRRSRPIPVWQKS